MLIFVTLAGSLASAQEKVIDWKFLTMAGVTTASTITDSYTTTWIRPHWRATPRGVFGPCNVESNAWLYGLHPTVARSYEIGAGKIIASVSLSYLLKSRRSRFWRALWPIPMAFIAVGSTQGIVSNARNC